MPPPTFAPGHDLVGRYRILRLLGIGHVAEAYLADDLSLRREVVVKVLLSHLAGYEDVRRSFRDRIVRSATLSHPHLERVFDGGQESGHIFMITEYLSGGSLEEVLGAGQRLDLDDTARLGRDVAGALTYLHANDFVHGALSPNSLLFDDEGRVRVTDVALSGLGGMHGEQLTYDEVRYLAPEQALGEAPGTKSDVYSLAVILFEAATGSSPFEALTPEAMLRTRVNAPLPVRPELGTLDMILAQAAVPDPRLRLDAEQFANRLGAAAPDSAPLVLTPRVDEPLLAQYAAPVPRDGIGFRPPSADQIVSAAPPERVGGAHARPRVNRFAVDAAALDAIDDDRRGWGGGASRARPPQRRRLAFVAVAVVLVLGVVGAGAVWKLGLLTQHHPVPSLVGSTVVQAGQVLKNDNYGFVINVTGRSHSNTVPSGQIISQSPAAGVNGKSGLKIAVTVSEGPNLTRVPTTLVGEDCASATSALLKVHLNAQCPSSAAVASATVPVGHVVRVLYRAKAHPTSVPAGSTLTLVLSTGAGTGSTTTSTTTTTTPAGTLETLPNLVGMNYAQVLAIMKTDQLYFRTSGPGAGTTTWTKVVSSNPAAGTKVKKFSTVLLVVTGGTSTSTSTTTTTVAGAYVTLPNLVGLDYAQVLAIMKTDKLYFTTTGPGAGTTTWTKVISSTPAAGTKVKKLSTITLNVK